MAKTEITKAAETSVARPRDIFTAMRDEMDRVFEQFERGLPRWPHVFRRGNGGGAVVIPELDVREDTKAITIEAELPGVDEKDVSVTLANGMLTIKGEKKQEKEEKSENYYLAERSYGAFERSLRLPDTIDDTKVEAKFDKGVLKVTAAKKPEAVKAERKIEIKKTS
jgi:HSP20 family protein